ncbi:MAG: DUF3883 domain-containing protein [Muribaculaceae bacterium]|nr:DUF3883 domain-containing protein [Muribaculaceae bacterium]
MNIQTTINNICQNAIDLFLNPHELLFRERVQQENRLRDQYKSRELLELLQNIDDAYDTGCDKPCVAQFRLSENWLEISNYGKPFTVDTIGRLCQGSVSSKQGQYIGCKGIGFRSVLNWAHIVEIYSGHGEEYISVRFSEEYANEQFAKIKSEDRIIQQIEELKSRGIEPRFPILKAPEYIPPITKEFDTVIRLHIKNESIRSEIISDIESFDSSVILFMPNIQQIEFIWADGATKSIHKNCSGTISTVIESGNTAEPPRSYYYQELETSLKTEFQGASSVRLAVALPIDKHPAKKYPLYSFFPIKDQKAPFSALLHATFCLTDNRNELDISTEEVCRVNREVFCKLLRLYVETVCKYESGQARIEKLKPLAFKPNGFSFDGNLDKLTCENDFRIYCSDFPIFYSVSCQYLMKDDRPIFLTDLPEHFKNEHFGRIVKTNSELLTFAEWICCSTGELPDDCESYLLNAINRESEEWPASVRIKTFKWWNSIDTFTFLPKLIKNIDNDFITSQKDACFLSGKMPAPPIWAKITNLAETDEAELFIAFKDEIDNYTKNEKEDKNSDYRKRVLPRLIRKSLINLQEQSSHRAVISHVNSSVNNDYEKAVDFVKWLLDVWKYKEFDESTVNEIKFCLPTADGKVTSAQNLYFNKAYDHPLGEEIFADITGYAPVASPCQLGSEESSGELQEMLKRIGVLLIPGIETFTRDKIDFSNNQDNKQLMEYIDQLHIPEQTGKGINFYKVSVSHIKNLSELLSKLSTSVILKWMDQAANVIENRYEPETSYIEYRPNVSGQRYNQRYQPSSPLPSFIRFIISSTPWIEISSRKYKPSDILLSDNNFLSQIDWPTLTDDGIGKLASDSGCTPRRVKHLLLAAGAKESVLSLSSNSFYGILLRISELTDSEKIDLSKKFSLRLYRDIIRNSRSEDKLTEFYADSPNKRQFFTSGKVLATNHRDKSVYMPVESVSFANSAVLYISNRYFIDIPPRSGQKDEFKEIFNLTPYTPQFSILDWAPASCNPTFQREFREFLPYIMAFRLNALSDVVNLTINLVSSITIKSDNLTVSDFEQYEVFEKSRSNWMILIKENDYSRIDKCRISQSIIEIFNVYFNFPARDFLSKVDKYFLADKDRREYFIMSDLGSNDEYNEACKKLNFNSDICKKIIDGLKQLQPDVQITSLIEQVNWIDPSSITSQEKIATILLKAKLTLNDLSRLADIPISFKELNDHRISLSYDQHLQTFKQTIYNILTCQIDRQSMFSELCSTFKRPELPAEAIFKPDFEADNYVYEVMLGALKAIGISKDSVTNSGADYDAIYNTNLSTLQKEIKDSNVYVDEFLNNARIKSLMFFNDFCTIKNKFDEFIREKSKQEAQADNITEQDLTQYIENAGIGNGIVKGHLPADTTKPKGTTVGGKRKLISESRNQRQGDIAEYIVIVKLILGEIAEVIDFLGQDYQVHWKSRAALRIKMSAEYKTKCNRSDCKNEHGYDIEVISADRSKHLFIEVKSSSTKECTFIMSSNEFNESKKHLGNPDSERYRIIFVANLQVNNHASGSSVHYLDHDLTSPCFTTRPKDLFVAYTPS